MTRVVCLLLLLAALPAGADAQRRTRRPPLPLPRHTGSIMLGASHLDLESFNAVLPLRYVPVKEDIFSMGGQGMQIRRRLILGMEGMAMVSPREATRDALYHTRLSAGYGTLNIGFTAVDKNNWLVYPLLGIGAGGVQYTITPTSGTTFDDALIDPGRSTRMTTAAMVVGLRLGAQYNFGMQARRGARPHGLSLGVRAGYNFAPLRGSWHEVEGSDIVNGPHTTMAGPQLVITIGGWREGPRR
jgi:hypothetical protein